ncbi:MAG: hypothetical protein D5R97_09705 [Candidatus Syntrophonatronum acetioxidans]|uniref:Bacterial Pleckstrin homology domain-containing protein n=1 Tax=Candidatus Syntrophonatronum acetioxidans TaxID=1795816 RepID=A0A424YA23_9FIRM|nr:MAG: hypothetical protein D5R97_09705 [Candidatus Syntrophonatronum acetioxidans]
MPQEGNNNIVARKIIKAQESRYLILFFSLLVVVISLLVLQLTDSFVAAFLTLIVLFYIVSAPQARLDYYVVNDNLVLGNLKGKKIINISEVKDFKILDLPLTTLPFLTNGVGYHVGTPKIIDLGRVELSASAFPAKTLIIITEDTKIGITPADPQVALGFLKDLKEKSDAGEGAEEGGWSDQDETEKDLDEVENKEGKSLYN